ncbi:hypothetical protein GGX14DRAFT_623730 [Mycena pura]|uniref:F-box domain-containing protein n=1 Tax=Mycena pura TaxID=153505 RepID=A0AAD6YDU4_9AGAR|nr:hypothetical protein GGX14DRAFT_623730 [Mycena pura]
MTLPLLLMTLLGLLSKLFRKLCVGTPPTSGRASLDGLPADVLGLVFEMLRDLDDTQQPYGHEVYSGACLIPLSETCRNMRAVTMPWIFREVYNWRRHGVDVWQDTLWCLFRLSVLEIHQVRFDGPSSLKDLSFPSLSSLSIGICGFRGVDRVADIDNARERDNIATFLRNVSQHLTRLSISGDLLSSQFCELLWCKLQQFSVTEHAPSPFIPVPNLVAQMRALQSLALSFTPYPERKPDDFPVPITLGTINGDSLEDFAPHLTSISISNVAGDDPIFGQLPRTLESLHLMPMWDLYASDIQISVRQGDFRFKGEAEAAAALDNMLHLDQLTDLTFTPFTRPPSWNLIRAIACNFSMLQCLHVGYSIWVPHDLYLVEFPDPAYFESLRLIQRLRHLKVSFDIFWDMLDRGPPAHGDARASRPPKGFVQLAAQPHYSAPSLVHMGSQLVATVCSTPAAQTPT